MNIQKYFIILIGCLALLSQSCKKTEGFEDPYTGGTSPIGVNIPLEAVPVPANGSPGSEVTVPVTGLKPFEGSVKFLFNGIEAEIIKVTETDIKVRVPAFASSGLTALLIDDQMVFGPNFKVDGSIAIDPGFLATKGANGAVNQVYRLADGRQLIVGSFTNYDDKGSISPLNRIVMTAQDGLLDRTFRSGRAANGGLSRVVEIGGKFIISGGFSGYAQRNNNISNITSLNVNGTIDTMGIHTFRRPDQTDTIKYFPRFNGGTDSYISKIYTVDGKIIATGNFRYHVKRQYDKPNRLMELDTVILDSTEARQILRMNADGSLDKTYRFDLAANTGLPGANGNINSFMHAEGANANKLVIYGTFSKFDGGTSPNIIRLNSDGTIDPSFNPGTGTGIGARNGITSLTYNELLQKYIITGSFTSYNGHPSAGIALINLDGSPDKSFTAKAIGGGYASFAKQLGPDGLIVVSGGFNNYNGISRSRFMILQPNGELAAGYNATGIFSGSLSDAIEGKNDTGIRTLLLMGQFNRFDGKEVNNIIRITIPILK
ncbi:DUF5008 domain-containing protein [Pedobacter miscanthi]|uniref:DUF5008 domain-containing protein n=1 Tax=Pedobacter miscanthi TaxID=2259170 RepID=UPI00292E1778|nr:DUF5008 domain-containing protein [Pedobacter miscanthi]